MDCARFLRASAHKTCFHCFCSNLVNFYRNKINFNVFWEPLKNLKLWSHLYHSGMASFALAGVFTFARIVFLSPHDKGGGAKNQNVFSNLLRSCPDPTRSTDSKPYRSILRDDVKCCLWNVISYPKIQRIFKF